MLARDAAKFARRVVCEAKKPEDCRFEKNGFLTTFGLSRTIAGDGSKKFRSISILCSRATILPQISLKFAFPERMA
jgi:hypothetical protein